MWDESSTEFERKYIRTKSVDNLPRFNSKKWFHIKRLINNGYLVEIMTEADYADDLALLLMGKTVTEMLLYV